MIHIDLFSGIGGFALAVDAVWPGTEHVFCEIDPFCQKILNKHWPDAKIYGDIRTITNANRTGRRTPTSKTDHPREEIVQEREQLQSEPSRQIDLLTGGFPCQPFSAAGRRKGTADNRYLWPEMYRVIREFAPRYVVAENVRGLLSIDGGLVFENVCLDMEAIGYEVQPFVIPACAVNAPHRRDRVWIVSHAKHAGQHGSEDGQGGGTGSDGDAQGQNENGESTRPALSRNAVTHPQHESTGNEEHGGTNERTSKGITGRGGENVTDPSKLGTGRDGKGQGQRGQRNRDERYQRPDWSEDWPAVAARLCRLDDGLPNGLPRPRGWRNAALKAYGNAIVPAVAIEILKAINICSPQSPQS